MKVIQKSKIKYCVAVCLFVFASALASAQPLTVTGTVSDIQGEPLPGVNIRVQGTTTGTTTDVSGKYSIVAPGEQSVLQYSFIGFTPQDVVVGSQRVVNITLEEDALELDEVVVVGYGTVRKSDVTGAVSRVTDKNIKERPVQNALQAMQGKATGVDITSNTRPGEIGEIRVRGNRSLGASNDPLYVVDGIPLISGSITDINPNDISSIEILKDASATAIYGSRAANGVILVSTKKGTKGRVTIDYDGTITFSNIHPLTDWMSAGERLDWQRQGYLNAGTYTGKYGTAPDPAVDYSLFMNQPYMRRILGTAYNLTDNDPDRPVLRPATPDEIAKGYTDQVPEYDASSLFDQHWPDLILRTGITQNHQLSLSAGAENSRIYASFGYLDQKSPMVDQDYKRYTVNLNGEITPKKWLTIGAMLNGSRSVQNRGLENGASNAGAKDSYGQALEREPYAPAYDENGLPLKPLAEDGLSYDNIMVNIHNADYEILQHTVMGNAYGEVKFTPWLKYRLNFGTQYRNRRTGSYYGPDFSNPFGARPPSSARNAGYYLNQAYFSWVVENLLYADKTWGMHTVGATLLQSAQQSEDENINIRSSNLTFPTAKWYAMDRNSDGKPAGYGTGYSTSKLMSYMVRLNYSLMNKYLITTTGRWDGASVLAEGNKWDFFPSVALAWKMEEESWMKGISWISQLKLRAGYGVTGNSAVRPYQTTGAIFEAPYYFNKQLATGSKSNVMPNYNLGWEKTGQWNVGIDFSTLNNRLFGSLEAYQANTYDLILNRSLPAQIGYSTVKTNIGKTRNRGIEITLSSVNVQTSDFSWRTDLSWSMNREKIVALSSGMDKDMANGWFVGEPLSVWFDYQYDRLWQDTPEDQKLMDIYRAESKGSENYRPGQSKIVDQPFIEDASKEGQQGWKTVTLADGSKVTFLDNGFGTISANANDDRKIIGTSRPDWVAGLTNTFTYKNWELNFFVYARMGNTIMGATQTYGRRVENSVWSLTNTGADFYQPLSGLSGLANRNGTRNYTDGSMVTVRNISLSYTLPEEWVKKIDVQRVQVYGQILNPFIWGGEAVRLGLNPDDLVGWKTNSATNADIPGSQGGGGQTNNTMIVRSWVIGLRVGF